MRELKLDNHQVYKSVKTRQDMVNLKVIEIEEKLERLLSIRSTMRDHLMLVNYPLPKTKQK